MDTRYSAQQTAVSENKWMVNGTWKFRQEYVQSNAGGNIFQFNVQAKVLHMVMESADQTDKHLEVFVDGKKVSDLTVNASTLYNITTLDGARHTVEIRLKEAGVRFYAATFS